ncbi:hypothetical protein A2U01_0023556, partial [Trifolium medium]|nr:hypothetical protein [Trifolium medium]
MYRRNNKISLQPSPEQDEFQLEAQICPCRGQWYLARRPLPAVLVSSVPPSYHGSWSPFEMHTFDAITKGNDFDEKRFLMHPLIAAEEVVVDKTKKKWTLKEDEAIEAAIARHGHKIKLIIKDEEFDVGLADKTVKQIEKIAKIGIKTLKNRKGTKANVAGSPPKPTKSGSLGDAARAA